MNPYFEQMILSASPIELVRLLYQKAITSVRDAREHLRNGRIAERCTSINVAYSVLLELTCSLREADVRQADGPDPAMPELTDRLKHLYGYMQARLVEANMKQVDGPLAEVLGLLVTLAEAWNSVGDPLPEPASQRGWHGGVSSAEMISEAPRRIAVSA